MDEPGEVVRREVPPVQTALLMLVVCGCAALNLYWHPTWALRLLTLGLAVACLVAAVVSRRMHLRADGEGVAVRFVGAEQRLRWPDVERVEVATRVRGSATVRFVRRDGSALDVPPSLLQPSRPTSLPAAMAQLRSLAAQLDAMRVAADAR